MNEIIHFLTHLLIQYVPFMLFMVVLVKQVELPVPAIPFLIAAGILVGAGQMALGVAVGLVILAALLGDWFRHTLGSQRGHRALNWLYDGVATILSVGSGIGLGSVFSDRLDDALSVVPHMGMMTLILPVIAAGSIIYTALHRSGAGRLVRKLTVQHVMKKVSAGENPAVIDLRPQGDRQDVSGTPGSLALVGVRPSTRSTVKRERM